MNGKQKITVGTLTVIFSLVGTMFAAAWALDYRYAKSEEVEKGFDRVLQAITDMNCATIRTELNAIALKKESEELTRYDKARRNDLELRWERVCLKDSS